MAKWFKRICPVLLVCLTLLSLCACQSKPRGDAPSSSTQAPNLENPPGEAPGWNLPPEEAPNWDQTSGRAFGTGGKRLPAAFPAVIKYSYSYLDYDNQSVEDGNEQLDTQITTLTGLKNKAIQDKLNQFCQTKKDELLAAIPEKPDLDALLSAHPDAEAVKIATNIYCNADICGNLITYYFNSSQYLWYLDAQGYYLDGENLLPVYDPSFTFDLRTGEQVTLSDLFFSDVDYIGKLNTLLTREIMKYPDELVRPFKGIPADYPYFSISARGLRFAFPENNPYFMSAWSVELSALDLYPDFVPSAYDLPDFLTDGTPNYIQLRDNKDVRYYSVPVDFSVYAAGTEPPPPSWRPGVRPFKQSFHLLSGADQTVMERINTTLDELDFIASDKSLLPPFILAALAERNGFAEMQPSAFYGFFSVRYYGGVSAGDEYFNLESLNMARTFSLKDGHAYRLHEVLLPEAWEVGDLIGRQDELQDSVNFSIAADGYVYIFVPVMNGDATIISALTVGWQYNALLGELF